MARIAGVDLPREKRVEIGLTYIYGIGRPTANDKMEKAGVNPDTRVKDLSEDEAGKIRKIIDQEYVVEGDLRRETSLNIKRSPCKRTENQDKRQNSQRSEEDCRKKEEVRR